MEHFSKTENGEFLSKFKTENQGCPALSGGLELRGFFPCKDSLATAEDVNNICVTGPLLTQSWWLGAILSQCLYK